MHTTTFLPRLSFLLSLLIPAAAWAQEEDPDIVDDAVERIATSMERSIAVVWCGDARVGTAFAVGEEGQLATAAHVARCPRTLRVEAMDGRRSTARVVSFGEEIDLAMLAPAEELNLEPIGLRDREATSGLLVYAVGHPAREAENGHVALTITRGVVGQVQDDIVYSDVAVGPGTSGGPLLDAHGRLVGVLYARRYESGVALAVPSTRLQPLTARPDSGEEARSPVRLEGGVSLGILADEDGALVGPRLDLGLALHDEWTFRVGAGFYLGSQGAGSITSEQSRTILQVGAEVGYRFRFELGDGAALTIEPTLGLSVGHENTTTTTYAIALLDPTCDPSAGECAFQTIPSEGNVERWLIRPTLGIRFGVMDVLNLGYQIQLDVENPENSTHMMTFGLQF